MVWHVWLAPDMYLLKYSNLNKVLAIHESFVDLKQKSYAKTSIMKM